MGRGPNIFRPAALDQLYTWPAFHRSLCYRTLVLICSHLFVVTCAFMVIQDLYVGLTHRGNHCRTCTGTYACPEVSVVNKLLAVVPFCSDCWKHFTFSTWYVQIYSTWSFIIVWRGISPESFMCHAVKSWSSHSWLWNTTYIVTSKIHQHDFSLPSKLFSLAVCVTVVLYSLRACSTVLLHC